MTKLPLGPSDPKVRQLLDRAAPGIEPPLDAKLRVSNRLTASLLHLPLGPAGDARHAAKAGGDSSTEALPRRLARVRPSWLGPAALAFVFGGATAGAVSALGTSRLQRIESTAPRPSASAQRPIDLNTGSAPPPTGGDAVAQSHLVEETPVAPVRSPETRMRQPVAPPAASAALAASGGPAAEQTLLNAARRALAAGRPDEALVHLAAHTRAYPETILAEEREAMQVNALVQSGHYDDARSRATRFVRRFPHSLLLESVSSAVEAIPRR